MKKPYLIYWSLFLASNSICALSSKASIIQYQGIAKDGDKIVYVEHHTVEYNEAGKLLKATTIYVSPTQKPIAELKSDFTSSLTVPTHITTDMRTGEIQGLRREDNKVTMYFKEKDKPEKTRVLTSGDEENRILVGCQGLNYYLLENLSLVDPEKTLPLRFLIPGKLDYYDFDMKQITEPQGDIIEFEIKVKNWFLKLFAPTLRVKYDRKQKHIVWYEGISNIKDDNDKNQKVTINYVYETEKFK